MFTDTDFIEELDDKFSLADIGSTLLEELAERLYQPQGVIREYIQNAVDAHRQWHNMLKQELAAHGKLPAPAELEAPIQIIVRPNGLSILDYGIGLDEDEMRKVKSIAVSSKRSADVRLTGHKGVGIWAGLSFFEQMTLASTKKGSNRGYLLTINFQKIKQAISEENDIGMVLNPHYDIKVYKADEDEHSTTVTLSKPVIYGQDFSNPSFIMDTVRRMCPCRIDPTVAFGKEVNEWYQDHGLEQFRITVDGNEVFRSFPSDVEKIQKGAINIDDKPVAFFWKSVHNTNGVFTPQQGQLIAFRAYQNGFALKENVYSDENLPPYERLSLQDYLKWHVGEIHIIHPDLRPNLRRDELEESEFARQFVKRLRSFYNEVQNEGRRIQKVRNTQKEYKEYETKLTLTEDKSEVTVIDLTNLETILNNLAAHEQKLSNHKPKKPEGTVNQNIDISAYKETKTQRKKIISRAETLRKRLKPAKEIDEQNQSGNNTNQTDTSDDELPTEQTTSDSNTQNSSTFDSAQSVDTNNTSIQSTYDVELSPEAAVEAGSVNTSTLPLDVILGILETVLSQILPNDTDLSDSILNALKSRIDRISSNAQL